MRDVVIVSGARTPIGDFAGSLSSLGPVDLGVESMSNAPYLLFGGRAGDTA